MQTPHTQPELHIWGAGLWGLLCAYRVQQLQKQVQVRLYDSAPSPDIHKTWSLHDNDLKDHPWMRDLISKSWAAQDLRFPKYSKTLEVPYHSIRAEDLYAKLSSKLHIQWRHSPGGSGPNLESLLMRPNSVVLSTASPKSLVSTNCGYQKFLGLNIRSSKPHGITHPVLMDAQVAQNDGYRFIYTLPWSETELLVEDTYYSNSPTLDLDVLEKGIVDHIGSDSLLGRTNSYEVRSKESGVIGVPHALPYIESQSWTQNSAVIALGTGAGLSHFTTGYSLPYALQFAERLAQNITWSSAETLKWLQPVFEKHRRENQFFLMLNKMMFLACEDADRYAIFQRFYTLPQGLTERFYTGNLSMLDKVRILSGRPPVPVGRALKTLLLNKNPNKKSFPERGLEQ